VDDPAGRPAATALGVGRRQIADATEPRDACPGLCAVGSGGGLRANELDEAVPLARDALQVRTVLGVVRLSFAGSELGERLGVVVASAFVGATDRVPVGRSAAPLNVSVCGHGLRVGHADTTPRPVDSCQQISSLDPPSNRLEHAAHSKPSSLLEASSARPTSLAKPSKPKPPANPR